MTIELLTLAATVVVAFATVRLMWNDNRRMRRPGPTLELNPQPNTKCPPGWTFAYVTMRNHAEHGIHVTGFRVKRRRGAIAAYEAVAKSDKYGGRTDPTHIEKTRNAEVKFRLAPAGTITESLFAPTASRDIPVYLQNVRSARDLKPIWHWSDGTRRGLFG